jgi:hypothetical protein
MLAMITVLLLIAGLRASFAVTMPVAAAIIIIGAIWPIKPWLDHLPRAWLSLPKACRSPSMPRAASCEHRSVRSI